MIMSDSVGRYSKMSAHNFPSTFPRWKSLVTLEEKIHKNARMQALLEWG